MYTWFCFTRLLSNHQKCKSIRQLPDLWLIKKGCGRQREERPFWSNIRGVQQNRCHFCDEKWSERGRVMRLREGHLKPLQRSDPPSAWTLCHVWRPMAKYQPHQPCQPLITPVWQSISSLQASESHFSSTVMPKVSNPCHLLEHLNSWKDRWWDLFC